ncbi:metallophosphoesterase [Marisediminicola sp. LYQ134]|uniref:metallophosphoesterase n=1 Tax=Marisediminicola sp. LYQ134 TaxID=3391061 RepID=UPI0039833B6C
MATLLHLSDLHLTGAGRHVPTADHKDKVIPRDVAGTRKKLLMSSLRGLDESLRGSDESLDAVIVTGDITNGGAFGGYAELTEVLDALGDSLPARERVLVIPGNHDVDRDATGDERFAGIRALRAEGYLVGWLSESEMSTEPAPVLTAADNSFVLVGLNSSIYSGSQLNTEDGLAAHIDELRKRADKDPAISALVEAWTARGRADIARMSDVELQEARSLLGGANESGPLRIVGLHHQLLPVGTAEEIKSFEGILNLGHFRRWLAANQVDLVLHGHKHNGAVMRDRIDSGGAHPPHELTILSAPSISSVRGADEPFGQLIRVSAHLPRLSEYDVVSVPGAESGAPTPLAAMARRSRPLEELTANGVISGATVDVTYARISAALPRLTELPTPLVCRIEDGASGIGLPNAMPDIPAPGLLRDEWLKSVIEWWQREQPGRAAKFNHGQFLHVASRGRVSAVERIVEELGKKPGSSRALAVLVNQDTLSDADEFPSFISLQFVSKNARLDAIAYFRKQEMSHWWPINIVEVAKIQQSVVKRMQGNIGISCGSITTVTAMPVLGLGMPTVSVPDLDRRVDRPGGMLDLVLPLFESSVSRVEVEARWADVFADWVPTEDEPAEGPPRPLLGLLELAETLESATRVYPHSAAVDSLANRIRDLHEHNNSYNEKKLRDWSTRVQRSAADVTGALNSVLDERDAS